MADPTSDLPIDRFAQHDDRAKVGDHGHQAHDRGEPARQAEHGDGGDEERLPQHHGDGAGADELRQVSDAHAGDIVLRTEHEEGDNEEDRARDHADQDHGIGVETARVGGDERAGNCEAGSRA